MLHRVALRAELYKVCGSYRAGLAVPTWLFAQSDRRQYSAEISQLKLSKPNNRTICFSAV